MSAYRMMESLLLCTLVLLFIPDATGLLYRGSCAVGSVSCGRGDKCISRSWVCDKERDCPDGSDEEDCYGSYQARTEVETTTEEEVVTEGEEVAEESGAEELEAETAESEALMRRLTEEVGTWGRLLGGLEEKTERLANRTARNRRELEELRRAVAAAAVRHRSFRKSWADASSKARTLNAELQPLQQTWLGTKDLLNAFLNRTNVLRLSPPIP